MTHKPGSRQAAQLVPGSSSSCRLNRGSMFDAAAAATAATAHVDSSHGDAPAKQHESQASATKEVAFVDSSLHNSKEVVEGLGKAVQVVVLQKGQDALSQISSYLAGHTDITALHLFSHGTPEPSAWVIRCFPQIPWRNMPDNSNRGNRASPPTPTSCSTAATSPPVGRVICC